MCTVYNLIYKNSYELNEGGIMGLLLGIIGVNVVAHTIGDKVVENTRAKQYAKVESERIRAEREAERIRAEQEAEKIRAKAELKAAKIQSKAIIKAAKIQAQRDVATTGMKTGFFTSLFGTQQQAGDLVNYREIPQTQDIPRVSYNNGSQSAQGTSGVIPQSTSTAVYQGGYTENRNEARPMFCRYCGTRYDADAVFCVNCGRDVD